MIADIITMAKAFTGVELTEREEQALAFLAEAAYTEWSGRLREDVTPEACEAAFVPACAWTALGVLLTAWEAALPVQSFTAGEVSVTQGTGGQKDTAAVLRCQAEDLMRPYTADAHFAFQGVKG